MAQLEYSETGLRSFTEAFRTTRKLLVGGDGIPLGEFLLQPVAHWIAPG